MCPVSENKDIILLVPINISKNYSIIIIIIIRLQRRQRLAFLDHFYRQKDDDLTWRQKPTLLVPPA